MGLTKKNKKKQTQTERFWARSEMIMREANESKVVGSDEGKKAGDLREGSTYRISGCKCCCQRRLT